MFANCAWSFLLDPDIGLLSYWLSKVGVNSHNGWLRDPQLAMPAVMLVGIWKNFGFYMVIYLAGLQSIPRDLYEAATLEGASGWKRFRHITWPLLANQTMLVLILCVVHGAIRREDAAPATAASMTAAELMTALRLARELEQAQHAPRTDVVENAKPLERALAGVVLDPVVVAQREDLLAHPVLRPAEVAPAASERHRRRS